MIKNEHWGSSLDDFLKEQGIYEQVTAAAIKAVIADLIRAELKTGRVSKKGMAEMMKMSRAQLDRLLDPNDDRATLETLLRGASAGRELRLTLE